METIWNYTFSRWPEKQADKYYLMLIEAIKRIAENPELGKSYMETFPGLMGLRENRHIIFYRIQKPGKVEITRILHERMDLKSRLDE